MYNNIFGTKQPKQQEIYTPFVQLNDSASVYTTSDIQDSITYNTIIKTIAKHVAKLHPQHVTSKNDKQIPLNSNLQTLLELRPNKYMSSYDFLYKITVQLLKNNNAYVSIQRDNAGNIISLFPIEFMSVRQVEQQNELCLEFTFRQGAKVTYLYSDIIHLRYDWISGDIISNTNRDYLVADLQLLDTLKQSFADSAQHSGGIKGVARVAGAIGESKWNQKAQNLMNQVKNNGGIVCTDSTVDFVATSNANPVPAEHTQLDFIRSEIYRALGVSEKIINNTYNEQEWLAFYESTVEPIAILLSQEFSAKLFTTRELGFGNRVVFETSRLEYTDTKTKTEMIKELRPLGILTTNQALEILGLAPIENGEDRIQSLNHVNTELINSYQQGKAKVTKADVTENEV
jgi:HK97 family phage portal protein